MFTDPKGDPEVAAGWMAMAQHFAQAVADAERRGWEAAKAAEAERLGGADLTGKPS